MVGALGSRKGQPLQRRRVAKLLGGLLATTLLRAAGCKGVVVDMWDPFQIQSAVVCRYEREIQLDGRAQRAF